MVAGVSSAGNVGVVAITALRYAQSDGMSVVMPVRPIQQVLASFRHIQLRPDSRLEQGIPMYKLRILDSLIDHLSRGGAAGTAAVGAASRGGAAGAVRSAVEGAAPAARRTALTVADIDSAIESFFAANRAGSTGAVAYRSSRLPEPGAVVDLVA